MIRLKYIMRKHNLRVVGVPLWLCENCSPIWLSKSWSFGFNEIWSSSISTLRRLSTPQGWSTEELDMPFDTKARIMVVQQKSRYSWHSRAETVSDWRLKVWRRWSKNPENDIHDIWWYSDAYIGTFGDVIFGRDKEFWARSGMLFSIF